MLRQIEASAPRDLDSVELFAGRVDRVEAHPVAFDREIDEVRDVLGERRGLALADRPRAVAAAAGDDVGHATDLLAALVVVVVGGEDELDGVLLGGRRGNIAAVYG